MKCYWTHNIADFLNCSLDGKFDFYGFPINECKFLKTCKKRKRILKQEKQKNEKSK